MADEDKDTEEETPELVVDIFTRPIHPGAFRADWE